MQTFKLMMLFATMVLLFHDGGVCALRNSNSVRARNRDLKKKGKMKGATKKAKKMKKKKGRGFGTLIVEESEDVASPPERDDVSEFTEEEPNRDNDTEQGEGTCLCGFPELACTDPAVACSTSLDCTNECGGLSTCLLPGASFPAECEDGKGCFYTDPCGDDDLIVTLPVRPIEPVEEEPFPDDETVFGRCLCGFPELYCFAPPIPCSESSDCAILEDECDGKLTCLSPFDVYPEECTENDRCFYEEPCGDDDGIIILPIRPIEPIGEEPVPDDENGVGTCLCGFPELFCSVPALPCNESAECAVLEAECGGLPTCLLPGDAYPVECHEEDSCYYEEPCGDNDLVVTFPVEGEAPSDGECSFFEGCDFPNTSCTVDKVCGKALWEEAEGMVCDPDAIELIQADRPDVEVSCIPAMSAVTTDYRLDRVRIFYDEDTGLVTAPAAIG